MTQPSAATYGPYSPIRKAGNYYFISGQVGADADKTAAADVATQCKQVLKNLQQVLQNSGLTVSDIVKTTVFLTDMNDFAAVNDVYVSFFPEPRPARSCVAVKELPRVANNPILVEIEAVAYKEDA